MSNGAVKVVFFTATFLCKTGLLEQDQSLHQTAVCQCQSLPLCRASREHRFQDSSTAVKDGEKDVQVGVLVLRIVHH